MVHVFRECCSMFYVCITFCTMYKKTKAFLYNERYYIYIYHYIYKTNIIFNKCAQNSALWWQCFNNTIKKMGKKKKIQKRKIEQIFVSKFFFSFFCCVSMVIIFIYFFFLSYCILLHNGLLFRAIELIKVEYYIDIYRY